MIYRIRWQASSHSHQGEFRNRRKHKGEPKLPFNLSLRALFLLLRGGLLLFLVAVARTAFFGDPHPGSRANVFF